MKAKHSCIQEAKAGIWKTLRQPGLHSGILSRKQNNNNNKVKMYMYAFVSCDHSSKIFQFT